MKLGMIAVLMVGVLGGGCGSPPVGPSDAEVDPATPDGAALPPPEAVPGPVLPDAGLPSDAGLPDAADGAVAVGGLCALDPMSPKPATVVPPALYPMLWSDDVEVSLHTYDPATFGTIATADSMRVVLWRTQAPSFTAKARLGTCELLNDPVSKPMRGVGQTKEIGLVFDLTQAQHPGFRFKPGATFVFEIADGALITRLVFAVPALTSSAATVTRSAISWTPFVGATGNATAVGLSGTTMTGYSPTVSLTSTAGTATWDVADLGRTHARVRWDVEQPIAGIQHPVRRAASWLLPL